MILKRLFKNADKFTYIALISGSILFGIATALTPKFKQNSNLPISIWSGIAGVLLFSFFCIAFAFIAHQCSKKQRDTSSSNSRLIIFIAVFFAILVTGLFYLLVYYPGTGNYDTLAIIKSNKSQMMSQHPWFFIVMVRAIRDIVFKLGGNYETTFVVLSIIQILLAGIIYASSVIVFYKKVPSLVCSFIAIWFIFSPFLNIYLITQLKDVPFSLLLTIWTLFLIKFWRSNGDNIKKPKTLAIVSILLVLSLIRNNGIYVSAFLIFTMFVAYPQHCKSYILLVGILIGVIIGNNLYEKTHHVTHLFKETVGIPLQQMAGVIYYKGKITKKQEQFLSEIVPKEYILEKFNPYSVDKIKWGKSPLNTSKGHKFLGAHKGEFIKTWIKLLPKNLKIYVDVYLKNTYGFWSLDNSQYGVYTSIYVNAFDEWLKKENVSVKGVFSKKWQDKIESQLKRLRGKCGSGTAFWIFLLLLIATGLRWGNKVYIIGSPVVANWLTIMISTPVAFQWRYTLSLVMIIPIILGVLFFYSEKTKNIIES